MYFEQNIRQLVADEAARLIYDEGYQDYWVAKQKAVSRMGATQNHQQPSNEEIEQALHQHIHLFESAEQAVILQKHREIALEAMQFLQDYHPALLGAALEGTSSPFSAITLYLRANTSEEVMFHLDEHQIPYKIQERRLNFGKKQVYCPMLILQADQVEVEILIALDDKRFSNTPISPVTGKAYRLADTKKLSLLLSPSATT